MSHFPKARLIHITLTLLLVQNITTVFARINTSPPMVAAGSYSNGTNVYPLLASSTDGGLSWTYTIDSMTPNLPNKTTSGIFYSTDCSGQTCLAAGQYSSGAKIYPLLATSVDGGSNWSYTVDNEHTTLPDDSSFGKFTSVSCADQTCIAVGAYFNVSNYYPLLMLSTDGGMNWNFGINRDTPTEPTNMTSGFLNSAHCSSSVCVAVGKYSNGVSVYPLLIVSTDGGLTWDYAIDKQTPTMPANMIGGYFTSTSCDASTCIAVGQYSNGIKAFPLLARSSDAGVSWSYAINSTTPTLPLNFVSGYLNSAHCKGTTCIAAGNYFNGTYYDALLATSSDSGVNWSYTMNSTTPTPPGGATTIQLFNVYSSSQAFITVGKYLNGVHYYPLLAASTDGGATWNYIIDSTTPTLPGDAVNGQFYNVTCSSQSCIAVGNYYNGTSYYPLVATSTDAGLNWSYTIESASPLLPNDYLDYGVFSGPYYTGIYRRNVGSV